MMDEDSGRGRMTPPSFSAAKIARAQIWPYDRTRDAFPTVCAGDCAQLQQSEVTLFHAWTPVQRGDLFRLLVRVLSSHLHVHRHVVALLTARLRSSFRFVSRRSGISPAFNPRTPRWSAAACKRALSVACFARCVRFHRELVLLPCPL